MPTLATTVLVALAGSACLAGPLSPPAGPVAPTHKTLSEVEPRIAINATNTPGDADSVYRISQPGSYYLAGNLEGQAGMRGIEMASSDVTVDLNGFTLQGVPGSLDGVATAFLLFGVTVKNGVVASWGEDGVDLAEGAGLARYHRVEGVQARANSGHGFSLGSGAIVADCTAASNGGNGFTAERRASITSSYAHSNDGAGFEVRDGSIVRFCVAAENDASGFVAQNGAVVAECVARSNGAAGINASGAVRVVNCTSHDNAAEGYLISSASSLEGSVARQNGGAGVNANFQSNIVGNTSADNGGAGFHVVATDARLLDNYAASNAIGYHVAASGNFLARNTSCSNTTNWSVVASNTCYVVTGSGGAAFNGNTGGNVPNTNPHANFSF